MASKKKLLQAAAGAAGGAGLDVDSVFSTHLYDGTGSAQTITNGIDLAGEGGLVWTKTRSSNQYGHRLIDEGSNVILSSDVTNGALNGSLSVTQYYLAGQSNGFNLVGSQFNVSGQEYVSWTWRKAPKFFDIVTYSGNGATRTISHNLGSDVGMLIVKRTDASAPWAVWHRQLNGGTNSGQYYIWLNSTNSEAASSPYWNNTAPTSTEFTVSSDGHVNNASGTYVAYLFAHNDGDGNFGPDADQDIIKCGSYTGNGSTDGTEVNLGFEPQWLMIKATSVARDWHLFDAMRGTVTGGNDSLLKANLSDAESSSAEFVSFTSTGFKLNSTDNKVNGTNHTYIYMAIRRGPLAAPESATDVFGVNYAYTYDAAGNTGGSSAQLQGYLGEPSDMYLGGFRNGSSNNGIIYDRLRGGPYLLTNSTSAESSDTYKWDNMAGFNVAASSQYTPLISYVWKRAPEYFDVVAYTGTGSGSKTINHNLGVVPEMMWVKSRGEVKNWRVYHKDLDATAPEDKYLKLNTTDAVADSTGTWNDTAPTATQFTVGNSGDTNNAQPYIAYLFATVAGVSKVGSYTGNGSSTGPIVDCGFSSGPRFVLIKRVDNAGSWHVFDSTRGIVAGNDPYLFLETAAAETSDEDVIDPTSSGFQLATSASAVNTNNETYIFYAIA